MDKERSVTIPLEEYERLKENKQSVDFIVSQLKDGLSYTLLFFSDPTSEYFYADVLRNSRFAFTNEQSSKELIKNLKYNSEEYRKCYNCLISCKNELDSIRSKWWYKLFN